MTAPALPSLTRLARGADGVVLLSRVAAVAGVLLGIGLMPWWSSHDPALTVLRASRTEREATEEVVASLRRRLGIQDGPWATIGHWLARLAHGDLGTSWVSGQPVAHGTGQALAVSLTLMAAAMALALLIAVGLMVPALRDGLAGRQRRRSGALGAALTALPDYLLAPVLVLSVCVGLGWLPPYGWGRAEQVILPAVSLGVPAGGLLGALAVDAVTEVFRQHWVTTWVTAGIRGRRLVLAVLHQALVPLLGQVALVVVGLTGAGVAVEKVFAVPGLGRALLGAASAQDVPALQAGMLLLLLVALVAGARPAPLRRGLAGGADGTGSLAAAPPAQPSGRTSLVLALAGSGGLAVLMLLGAGRDPYAVVASRLAGPTASLPLGADALGRDLLARVAHGAVATLSSAVVVTGACLVIGILAGLLPRASTGLVEVGNAVPAVLAGLVVAAVAGPSRHGAAMAVACVSWAPLGAHAAALMRSVRERPDVVMAPALGEPSWLTTLTRVLPAVVPVLVRHAALRLPGVALALTGLGFLGLGAKAPSPEWGLVLAEGLAYLERAPWAAGAPALALVALAVSALATSRVR
ncbi:ABC transporter permease subunit [Actinomyces urogenitalis]|uniref:ABC transporter permease subunit n=1 Tax=Actinomyces urogenitalis TaxID=103621 RepID=UPI0029158324|nr:ABC transporter permease subunit [Actinomyces urogenitalis]MDU5427410.1 ABC transporter permease subunit [Actinomyces urogenitalis]